MSSLIPSGSASGTGSMTLAAPVTNSNQTATLPDATGTIMVSGNMPAFSAYPSAAQSVSTSAILNINTKEFDTAGAFNNTGSTVTLNGLSVPAYAFCPPVAGYYIITAHGSFNPATSTRDMGIVILKNGAQYRNGSTTPLLVSDYAESIVTSVIYLNGTGDYLQSYIYQNSGFAINTLISGAAFCYFTGALVRAA